MTYILINQDNTLNWIGSKWDNSLVLEGVTVIEISDKSPKEVMGDLEFLDAVWDASEKKVKSITDNPELVNI